MIRYFCVVETRNWRIRAPCQPRSQVSINIARRCSIRKLLILCRNANPPTLLLTLHRIVKDLEDDMSEWWRDYLRYRHRNKQWCGYGSDSVPYHFVGSESGSELFDIKFILSEFRIRIHFLRIRIQRIRMEANTDPDPDPIRIQGFIDQKLKKNNSWKKN